MAWRRFRARRPAGNPPSQPGRGDHRHYRVRDLRERGRGDEARRLDYLPKPFTPDQVRLRRGRVLEARRLKTRVAELEEPPRPSGAELSSSRRARPSRLHETAARGRPVTVVLLRGESGTGKNVMARWIRAHSPRAGAPFVSVNCPALSTELMSSTLFGHKKGAFTGAVADAVGKVQEAEGGTLFLDEVGDLSPDAQARLLRFLNDRSYERLGERGSGAPTYASSPRPTAPSRTRCRRGASARTSSSGSTWCR